MEREEQKLIKKIKAVYTKIAKTMVDPSFKFPEGGKVNIKLSSFIHKFTAMCGGEFNMKRLADYCIFQIHKNRTADYQNKLAPNTFGDIAFNKYISMSSKEKKYVEDRWLAEGGLTRNELYQLAAPPQKEHPQAKYIYMPSEESTKKRCLNTEIGLVICATSTLMWSPFSPACQQCMNVDSCKAETQIRYPELFRLRCEEYGKRKK